MSVEEKLLMIEDDIDLAELTQQYLQQQGFEVVVKHDPVDALMLMQAESFQLVLLDIMLPNLNGFEVCQRIRRFSQVPILMLTAKGEVEDKVKGLELGADDYLPKPFDPRELVARCHSLLRRNHQDSVENNHGLRLDAARLLVTYENNEIDLTAMEADTLALFLENKGQVLSRDDLLNHLRGIEADVYSRSIDILISRLRAKLKKVSDQDWIFTVRSKGYRFAEA